MNMIERPIAEQRMCDICNLKLENKEKIIIDKVTTYQGVRGQYSNKSVFCMECFRISEYQLMYKSWFLSQKDCLINRCIYVLCASCGLMFDENYAYKNFYEWYEADYAYDYKPYYVFRVCEPCYKKYIGKL